MRRLAPPALILLPRKRRSIWGAIGSMWRQDENQNVAEIGTLGCGAYYVVLLLAPYRRFFMSTLS